MRSLAFEEHGDLRLDLNCQGGLDVDGELKSIHFGGVLTS